jgi:hypothetical protein
MRISIRGCGWRARRRRNAPGWRTDAGQMRGKWWRVSLNVAADPRPIPSRGSRRTVLHWVVPASLHGSAVWRRPAQPSHRVAWDSASAPGVAGGRGRRLRSGAWGCCWRIRVAVCGARRSKKLPPQMHANACRWNLGHRGSADHQVVARCLPCTSLTDSGAIGFLTFVPALCWWWEADLESGQPFGGAVTKDVRAFRVNGSNHNSICWVIPACLPQHNDRRIGVQ